MNLQAYVSLEVEGIFEQLGQKQTGDCDLHWLISGDRSGMKVLPQSAPVVSPFLAIRHQP